MFVVSEFSSAPPDVVESELLLPNTKLNLKSESTPAHVERDGDLPVIVTAAIIVLGSLVTVLLAVIIVIFYFRYQNRANCQPLKATNRFCNTMKFCLSSGGYYPGMEVPAS